jgi:azurin
MTRIPVFLLLALLPGTAAAQSSARKPPAALKPKAVTISMREGLRFDPPRFEAKPGQELIVRLDNADTTHQQHNFVIVRPGSRDKVTLAALALGEKALELAFVPPLPEVLASSPLLDAEKSAEVRWRLPDEPGIYPYVCTFPGHGAVMFGAVYSGVKMPALNKDPNLPAYASQSGLAGGGKRPFVQRLFLPDSGPASIAVALPGTQNFCWDAGPCRLRYAWEGAFIDAAAHWAGKGADRAEVPAPPWWTAGPDENPARRAWPEMPAGEPEFLGYRTTPAGPVFRYRIGSTEISETISALPGQPGLTLSVATADGKKGQCAIEPRQP